MSRKTSSKKTTARSSSKKTTVSKEDLAKKAREKRLAMAKIDKASLEKHKREDFRKYFVQIKKKLKLTKEMEIILWEHLKTIGCDTKDKFEKGITHFGYKI